LEECCQMAFSWDMDACLRRWVQLL
jgi:hypothetical protein